MKQNIIEISLLLLLGLWVSGCEKELNPAEPGNLVAKTVDQDPSLPSITVNGAQLHAESFGNPDSAMVVVIHGGPGNDYRYLLDCKAFADQGYYVVFYDQRGSGLSQRFPAEVYDVDIMVNDLDAVISHYRTSPNQKVFLLGHSWGAMLATAYINTHTGKIAGAILAEPGGFTWEDTYDYIQSWTKLDLFSETTADELYFDQLITGDEDQHEILDYKLQLFSVYETTENNALGITQHQPFWRFGAVVNSALLEKGKEIGFDFTTNLSAFDTRVLFAYSENNRAYGLSRAQHVSSAYPNVQLELVPDTGHELVNGNWPFFYPLALNYLNSLK